MSREYRFDRYRKGRKMAEGLVLTKPTTVEQAMETVYLLAGPSDTFVLREDLACLAAVEAERDAARAEVEKLRDKAELLDEIITNRISVSYRDGIPVTAHIWSARTDNGFGTGNTLPEALAALRAAKGGGK